MAAILNKKVGKKKKREKFRFKLIFKEIKKVRKKKDQTERRSVVEGEVRGVGEKKNKRTEIVLKILSSVKMVPYNITWDLICSWKIGHLREIFPSNTFSIAFSTIFSPGCILYLYSFFIA